MPNNIYYCFSRTTIAFKTLFFVFLLFSSIHPAQAFTQEIDRRVSIALNLFPNIVSVDTQIAKKLGGDHAIQVFFVFNTKKDVAQRLLKRFRKRVKTIRKTPVVSMPISLTDLLEKKKQRKRIISAIFITEHLPDAALNTLLAIAIKHHALLFSPFEGDVKRGVTAGVYIGSKILPYINSSNVKKSGLQFHPLFLRLARKYE